MKLKIKKTVEEEVEVKLPYFFKTPTSCVAVLNERKTVTVSLLCNMTSVAILPICDVYALGFDMGNSIEITAAEFHEQLLLAANNISVELNSAADFHRNKFIENEHLKSEGY